jgi:hypothetical protein
MYYEALKENPSLLSIVPERIQRIGFSKLASRPLL